MRNFDLDEFQAEVGAWHRRHFPDATPTNIVLKAVEEIAELAVGHNHQIAGGTVYNPTDAEIDAIGDVSIVLAALCDRWRLNYGEIVTGVWAEVQTRTAHRVHRHSTVADSQVEEGEPCPS